LRREPIGSTGEYDMVKSKLGSSTVTVMQGNKPLAVVDKTLAG
jgi:hypothetical protein